MKDYMAWRLDGPPHPVMYLLRAKSPSAAACRWAWMAIQCDEAGTLHDQRPMLVKVGDLETEVVFVFQIGRRAWVIK